MPDKGFDVPRPPDAISEVPQKERSIKLGEMIVVRRSDGSLQDGWMAHAPQNGRMMASRTDANGVQDVKDFTEAELTELNKDVDPFRNGAWGISVQRSDGRVESDWTSRGLDPQTGRYVLEKADGKGQVLRKTVDPKALRNLNS